MESTSLQDIFSTIEAHLHDVTTYAIEIEEDANNDFKVTLKEANTSKNMKLLLKDSCYDAILKEFCHHFENVSIIKIHTVFNGDYFYMIIHKNVCITFRFYSFIGQQWISEFVNCI